MGTKRAMLRNGLGSLITAEAKNANRIIDLFCGGASVAWFASVELKKPVSAFDLQEYSAVLARAVLCRTTKADYHSLEDTWLKPSKYGRSRTRAWKEANSLDSDGINIATWRSRAQKLCASYPKKENSVLFHNYGGHYFSPTQAISLDSMMNNLPTTARARDLCLASLIVAASRCAAAPGHTAQPFKATRTAGRYLREAWMRDPFQYAAQALKEMSELHATKRGSAQVGEANKVAKKLKQGDLVFVDPPYSGVQYSRFYHVLETIARGECGEVSGVGRYPPISERPVSEYSLKSKSEAAMDDLLVTLSNNKCKVIMTFPNETCSNGLSGGTLLDLAGQNFKVIEKSIKTRFSTLGGNSSSRSARKVADELMLVLHPR